MSNHSSLHHHILYVVPLLCCPSKVQVGPCTTTAVPIKQENIESRNYMKACDHLDIPPYTVLACSQRTFVTPLETQRSLIGHVENSATCCEPREMCSEITSHCFRCNHLDWK
uniref:Activin_recp domain-containing protein n=1 Tax=Steinernema glaseri TaxID=37863 RepID=A0A1I8A3S8_9BILA